MDSELRIRLRQALFEFFDQSYGGLPVEETDLAQKIDSIVREAYKAGEDHALAAVVRERTIEHHDIAALVREFHEVFRLPMSDLPTGVEQNLAKQRHQQLLQEVTEVYDAILHANLANIAQELADCVYVLYGTALTYGIDLDAVLLAVHAANMTKLFPDGEPHTVDGKIVKGPDYRKPNIAAVLDEQIGLRTGLPAPTYRAPSLSELLGPGY